MPYYKQRKIENSLEKKKFVYTPYANGSPEDPLSKGGSGITGIILFSLTLLFTNNNDHNDNYILCH